MKIAITGHSAGIGLALANVLKDRGHEIIGLSRRNGFNIRNIPKVVAEIESADIFINNAQAGYAQVELLYAMYEKWKDDRTKHIWCISTEITRTPVIPEIPSMNSLQIAEYKNQKVALEEAARYLQYIKGVNITIIKPGAVATQPGQTADEWPYCNVDVWATAVVDLLADVNKRGLDLKEFSLTACRLNLDL